MHPTIKWGDSEATEKNIFVTLFQKYKPKVPDESKMSLVISETQLEFRIINVKHKNKWQQDFMSLFIQFFKECLMKCDC